MEVCAMIAPTMVHPWPRVAEEPTFHHTSTVAFTTALFVTLTVAPEPMMSVELMLNIQNASGSKSALSVSITPEAKFSVPEL